MKRHNSWHIAVLIPARNEEDLLPRCLESILAAKGNLAGSASVDLVVVADSSVDQTEKLAAEIMGRAGFVHSISAGAVGTARRIASSIALTRYRGPLHRCWLANTDADCIVPLAWLSDQLNLAQLGVEALAGTVSVDTFDEHEPDVQARFKATYRIESDGSHPHIHGANLGVRADCYLRAGGWHDLNTAEDHDLWRRLSLLGTCLHSTSRVEVQTSGRRIGRAPHGFAAALSAHHETAA